MVRTDNCEGVSKVHAPASTLYIFILLKVRICFTVVDCVILLEINEIVK